jgi:hypothetical protein
LKRINSKDFTGTFLPEHLPKVISGWIGTRCVASAAARSAALPDAAMKQGNPPSRLHAATRFSIAALRGPSGTYSRSAWHIREFRQFAQIKLQFEEIRAFAKLADAFPDLSA